MLEQLDDLPKPPPRIRALNPFDPVIRDRKRLERLFGFHYRIEVFVPAAKRQYGYYVFPLLEGDRFIGRIDMTHDARNGGVLKVTGLWLEPKVAMTQGREQKLHAELKRIQRFVGACGLETVEARFVQLLQKRVALQHFAGVVERVNACLAKLFPQALRHFELRRRVALVIGKDGGLGWERARMGQIFVGDHTNMGHECAPAVALEVSP